MKIIICTRDLMYGVGTHVKSIIKMLDNNSHYEKIVVIGPSRLDGYSKKVQFIELKLTGKYFVTRIPFFFINAYFMLLRLILVEKFDLIHAHTPIFCLGIKLPIITTVHVLQGEYSTHYVPSNVSGFFANIVHNLFKIFDTYMAYASKKVVFVSNTSLKHGCRMFPKQIEKFVIWQNSVDTTIFKPVNKKEKASLRKKYNISSSAKVLLYVGRLDPLKGIILLIGAFNLYIKSNAHKNTILLVVGDGTLLNTFQKSENIRFLGRHNVKSLTEIYCISDIYICPSYYETFGITVIEAMASSLVVTSTNVGDINRFLDRKYIIFSLNVMSILNMISKLLNYSSSRAKKIGLLNRQLVLDMNLKVNVNNQLDLLYSNIQLNQ